MRHEKFSALTFGARSDSDGSRCFMRTRVRTWRGIKYSELAGPSAASSGIEAAIVTTRRATVFRVSTQVATSASLTCFAHAKRNRVPTIVPAAFSEKILISLFETDPSPPAFFQDGWDKKKKG